MAEAIWGFIHEPSTTAPSSGLTGAAEVVLTFHTALPTGTAISIQTGSGYATPSGSTLTLPAAYNTSALVQVILNGSELRKPNDATRVSSTQLSFPTRIRKDSILKVRIFS